MSILSSHSIWPQRMNGAGRPAGTRSRVAELLALTLGCVLLAFCCLTAVGAQSGSDEATLERNVKAAFLYKFLGYVDYPESATPGSGEPLVIGVIGADNVAEELSRITAGRSMNGRAVVVRKLRHGEAPGKVHMLYIGDDDMANVEKALASVRQAPVLTVTDMGRNPRQESVINFRIVDERVRFEVSLEAAEKNNLKLSSRLLAVAYKVLRGGR